MKSSVVLLIFGLFLVSCSSLRSSSDFSTVKKAIIGNVWLLQDENGAVVSYNGQHVSMEFRQESSGLQAVGFAGCNRYFSTVDIQPGFMNFSQPGATLMACPDMEGETAFLDLLSKVNAYEISGNEFKLYQDKILLLRFKSQ